MDRLSPESKDPQTKLNTPSQTGISRRQFLKLGGATFFGLTTIAFPGVTKESYPFQHLSQSSASPADIDKALAIASASAMAQEAIEQLSRKGIELNLTRDTVRESAAQNDLTGLVISHQKSHSPRMGADLLLTVNLQKESLNFVQFFVGWSLLEMLVIRSVVFDIRNPVYIEPLPPLAKDLARTIRPREECMWAFPRPDPPLPTSDDLVEVGWPPETAETNYWHYLGCSAATWGKKKGEGMFFGAAVEEQRSKPTDQYQAYDLEYKDYFDPN